MKNIKSSIILEEDSVNYTEMKLIKEKYMKPVQVYLLHPDYFLKLLERQKKNILKPPSVKERNNDNDIINSELNSKTSNKPGENKPGENKTEPQIKKKYISDIDFLINDIESYKTNFNCIFSNAQFMINDSAAYILNDDNLETNLITIDKEELLYFYFTFGKKIVKSNDMYLVGTKWVIDKKHIDRVFKTLEDDISCLNLDKTLYKTSMNEIDDLIREEFKFD
jgi:hypothetical protein